MAATHKSQIPREGESFLYHNQAGGGRERSQPYNGFRRFTMVEHLDTLTVSSSNSRAAFPGAVMIKCVIIDAKDGEEKVRNLYLHAMSRDNK